MLVRQLQRLTLPLMVGVVAASAGSGSYGQSDAGRLPPITIEHFLPVHTKSMTPGPFEPIRRRTGVSRPFFLVGSDAYSLKWLAQNHDRLIKLHALGLVVEVADAVVFGDVESAAAGLVVRPVPADLIAKHLGVKHYPALITAEGIFP